MKYDLLLKNAKVITADTSIGLIAKWLPHEK